MAIGIMGYFVWERAKPGRHIASEPTWTFTFSNPFKPPT